jgi:curved DNA-binding protein CbpA
MKTHYEALGVEPDADAEQIKAALRKIAKQCHPDRNADPQAHAVMASANSAWSVLKDPLTRAAYDAELAQESEIKHRTKKASPPKKSCVSCGQPSFQQSPKCWRCLLRESVEEEARLRVEEEARLRVEEARRRVEEARRRVANEAQLRDKRARARAEDALRRRRDAQSQAKMREESLKDQQKSAEDTTNMHGYDDPIRAPDSDTLFEAILSESALRAARDVKRDGVNVWLHIAPDMRLEAKGSTVDLAREVHRGLRQANRLLGRVSKWFIGGR